MSETLVVVEEQPEEIENVDDLSRSRDRQPSPEELAVARELVAAVKAKGVSMTGPDGLLKALTRSVIEAALNEEMAEHLGYDKHEIVGRNTGNSRNGTRVKTVITEASGPVTIEVPRDREGSFEPVIVGKHQRRLGRIDELVLSLYSRGMTSGDISAHFAEIYGASVSKDTVSRITDKVLEEMADWVSRPLNSIYAAVFIDAIVVKVRDGQAANRPFYAAIGVDLEGNKDILALYPGQGGGESAKYWLAVLTELKNRGVKDIFFLVCDGLTGLPEAVNAVFPDTTVQACIIHLIRGSFRYVARQHWDKFKHDLKPIYTAVNAQAAEQALEALEKVWGGKYPAMIRLWRNAWAEFVPFLDYDQEIRRVLCSTNAIESLNARYRRAVRARGHFPTEAAAMKCLYLVTRSLDPTGKGQTKWAVRWKPALNAFAITFANRFPATETN